MNNSIIIIDPFLKEPAEFALNTISQLLLDLQTENNLPPANLLFFFPQSGKKTLRNFINSFSNSNTILGVISLGSYANITDNHDWVRELGEDLKELVIEKYIPFLGICFSHQLFAHIYNLKIDYIDGRESLPDNKYNEFREIEILHPRLQTLLDTLKFTSMAKHEQEVKSVLSPLEITCISENCKIEGLVHSEFPAFSFQSHPEEFHNSRDGWNLIKRFLLFFYLHNNLI